MMKPIITLGYSRLRSFSGMMLGTTDSISVKQKSPQSIQANKAINPRVVYESVPHR